MIFADSSFWIGLFATRDSRHAPATQLLREHAGSTFLTSNQICGETWTFLNSRYGHRSAMSFVDRLDQTLRLRVAFVSEELEAEAWAWLRRHDEREYSFVDATSFALMRKLRVREAFAFDGDFTAAGFVELRA